MTVASVLTRYRATGLLFRSSQMFSILPRSPPPWCGRQCKTYLSHKEKIWLSYTRSLSLFFPSTTLTCIHKTRLLSHSHSHSNSNSTHTLSVSLFQSPVRSWRATGTRAPLPHGRLRHVVHARKLAACPTTAYLAYAIVAYSATVSPGCVPFLSLSSSLSPYLSPSLSLPRSRSRSLFFLRGNPPVALIPELDSAQHTAKPRYCFIRNPLKTVSNSFDASYTLFARCCISVANHHVSGKCTK